MVTDDVHPAGTAELSDQERNAHHLKATAW
jgi:hypothetical protein